MEKPILSKTNKRALIAGCESTVGAHVLELLIDHPAYQSIKVLATKSSVERRKGVDYHFSPLQKAIETDLSCDDFFFCYDSSFFNLSGEHYLEKENFKYVPRLAHQVAKSGANQLMFLSSKSADRDSLFFGNRIRGLVEESVRKVDFWAKHIFKPSIIVGEDSSTWGKSVADTMGSQVDKYTGGWLKKNKPIEATKVASAMVEVAQHMRQGTFTVRGSWLQDFDPDNPLNALQLL